jgi:hypothetical protein
MNLIEYAMYLYAAGISGIQYPFANSAYKGLNTPIQAGRNYVAMGDELEDLAA